MNRVTVYDSAQNDSLVKNGFAIVSLFGTSEITELTQIFEKHFPQNFQGFYSSSHLANKNLRKEISDQILELVGPQANKHFHNMDILGAATIAKTQGESAALPYHQDWNIVDETRARSYNLWIPLVDVNSENGTMNVVPGSHQNELTFRGPNISNAIPQIEPNSVFPIQIKTGQAVLYDHALWHSSPPNNSSQIRPAVVCGVVPNDESLIIYYGNGEEIEVFQSHRNFFFENDGNHRPSGLRKIKSITRTNSESSQTESFWIRLKTMLNL